MFLLSADLGVLIDAIPLQLYGALEINSLLAIPLFLLVGKVMNKGRLTHRLIAVAELSLYIRCAVTKFRSPRLNLNVASPYEKLSYVIYTIFSYRCVC